jgi:hypothetical protein
VHHCCLEAIQHQKPLKIESNDKNIQSLERVGTMVVMVSINFLPAPGPGAPENRCYGVVNLCRLKRDFLPRGQHTGTAPARAQTYQQRAFESLIPTNVSQNAHCAARLPPRMHAVEKHSRAFNKKARYIPAADHINAVVGEEQYGADGGHLQTAGAKRPPI